MTPANADEPIQTEIDPHEFSVFQSIAPSKPLRNDMSQAVMTDYDITDEVEQFAQSFKHQIDFRDPTVVDRVAEDKNIEEVRRLKLEQQKLLTASRNPRYADSISTPDNSRNT